MIKKIKKGDKVEIISGKDRGRTGLVKRVFLKKDKLLVAGINMAKKHNKPQKGQAGGIVELEVPIWVGKVMLICSQCNKRTRVGYQLDKNNKKYRICRKCQSLLDKQVKGKK